MTNRWVRVSVSLLLPPLVLLAHPVEASDQVPRPYSIHKETTWFTKPLTKDGLVDYAAAANDLFGDGVTQDTNAVVKLVRITGFQRTTPVEEMQLADRLNVSLEDLIPASSRRRFFVTFAADQPRFSPRRQQLLDQLSEACSRPWRDPDFPTVAAWLQQCSHVLQPLVEATRHPRYFIPHVADPRNANLLLWPARIPVNGLSELLAASSMREIARGDLDLAMKLILAQHRLARLAAQMPDFTQWVIAGKIQVRAFVAGNTLLNAQTMRLELVQTWQQQLSRLPPMPSHRHTFQLERIRFLASVQDAAQSGKYGDVDWNSLMKQGNKYFDAIDRAETDRELEQIRAGIAADIASMRTRGGTVRFLELALGTTPITEVASDGTRSISPYSAVTRGVEGDARVAARRRLSLIGAALAVAAHRAGSLPAHLEDNSLDLDGDVLIDPHSAHQFRYRILHGRAVVYSVGPDGKDDDARTYNTVPPGDDIVVIVNSPS